MTNATVQYKLDTIFFGARDVKKAIRLYSSLFGLPILHGLYDSPFYPIAMRNGVKLLLAHRFNALMMHSSPACMLTASDIVASYYSLQNSGAEMMTPQVEQRTGMRFFLFRDADGTEIAVSDKPLPYTDTRELPATGPVDLRIDAMNLYVNDVESSSVAFGRRLKTLIPAMGSHAQARQFSIGVDTPIHLHRRHVNRDRMPFLRLRSTDLDAVRCLLRDNGVPVMGGTDPSGSLVFADPDGNRLEVVQELSSSF